MGKNRALSGEVVANKEQADALANGRILIKDAIADMPCNRF